MSEFQYYEFQAIDRTLTEREMAMLRKCSSRAQISPSRFVNHYSYGDFRGDVEEWMKRYFDAFLYMANWGTRRLILRFSKQAIDASLVKQYCPGECARCWTTKTHTLVEYCVDECGDGAWLQEDDGSLSSMLPLHAEIHSNDFRLLYLGWLLCVQYGELAEKKTEPPVPPGLGSLSPALKSFVDFFAMDRELLKSAALNSSDKLHEVSTEDIEPCIAGLSNAEKASWLRRLALEDNRNLGAEFRRHLLPDCGVEIFSDKPRRTIAEITNPARRPKKSRVAKSS